jgi:hypothetical protein
LFDDEGHDHSCAFGAIMHPQTRCKCHPDRCHPPLSFDQARCQHPPTKSHVSIQGW